MGHERLRGSWKDFYVGPSLTYVRIDERRDGSFIALFKLYNNGQIKVTYRYRVVHIYTLIYRVRVTLFTTYNHLLPSRRYCITTNPFLRRAVFTFFGQNLRSFTIVNLKNGGRTLHSVLNLHSSIAGLKIINLFRLNE